VIVVLPWPQVTLMAGGSAVERILR
jgi:hypothetical protein